MKQYRTSLLAQAVSGSVRTPAQGPAAYTARTESVANSATPDPADHSDARFTTATSRQSTALRERLSQTRARIARSHVEHPPHINVEWDPDEPPTRLYRGESLPLPRSSHARELSNLTATSTRAHASSRAPHARPRAEPAAYTSEPVAAHPPRHSMPQAAEVIPHDRVTLPGFARLLKREATVLRARLNQRFADIHRTDSALRRRVTYCAFGLLVIAVSSRLLFSGHSAGQVEQPVAIKPAPVPQRANVSINSDPPGALIALDGQASNQVTPAKLTDLAPGRHVISLKLAGYAETKEALHLPADALVSIKLASLSEPRFVEAQTEQRATSRAELRAQARELARERRAAARAAKVLLRYRARMGLPPDPVAQELVDAYGPTQSAEP